MALRKHLILAGGIALACLQGCNRDARGSGAQGGSGDNVSSAQRASIADLKRSLDAADERIRLLEERAAKSGDKLKQDLKDEIAKLQAARDKLYGQLQALQTAGASEWEDLKSRTASSVDSLGRVVAKTWKSMASEERSATTEGGE